ncbi:hypothetical protein F443_18835 [Phytophthora nicotianae P1569]|uniref:Uncharacterized protein n=1 Tax=Phytophthora nicotianae P1569 TaxID=1317065 RepID=V9E851_PHYNI|nr:hypothetical protein F443_18835 [Phytophthora nicotianae P1569]
MQSLQHRLPRKGIPALIASVEEACRDMKTDTVDNIFLSLQACMLEILRQKGVEAIAVFAVDNSFATTVVIV